MKAHNLKRTFAASTSKSLATALALSVSFATLSVAHADEYSEVCSGTQSPTGQKASYCAAAKQAKDASKKEATLTLIYGAVAGTCAATCAGMLTTAYICEGASLGAAAADVILTKNFMSAAMAAGSAGLNMLLADSGSTAAKSTTAKFACWATAAGAALNSVMHGMSKSNDDKTASSNITSAKNVNDSNTGGLTFGSPSISIPSTATNGGSTSGTPTTAQISGGSSTDPSTSCADTGSVGGAVACAATADPKVAGLVASPEFQKAFEQSSGMKLDDYLKNGGNLSASDAIKAAGGAALGEDGSVRLGKAIATVEQAIPDLNAQNSAAYAAAGHGKGASGDDDLANMMNGLMGKLMPKAEDGKKSGVSEVKFSGSGRNLASVTAEDPTVSLFERVAYRYSHVMPRLLSDPAKRTLSDWSGATPSSATATKHN
ncbi:MAG: hypothetical protein ACJ763_19315 [Bdellovibrionia bacterium]